MQAASHAPCTSLNPEHRPGLHGRGAAAHLSPAHVVKCSARYFLSSRNKRLCSIGVYAAVAPYCRHSIRNGSSDCAAPRARHRRPWVDGLLGGLDGALRRAVGGRPATSRAVLPAGVCHKQSHIHCLSGTWPGQGREGGRLTALQLCRLCLWQHAASKAGRSPPAVQVALAELASWSSATLQQARRKTRQTKKPRSRSSARAQLGNREQPQAHGTALSEDCSGAERRAPRQPWARRGTSERPNCETPPTPPVHAALLAARNAGCLALLPARAHRPWRAPAPWRCRPPVAGQPSWPPGAAATRESGRQRQAAHTRCGTACRRALQQAGSYVCARGRRSSSTEKQESSSVTLVFHSPFLCYCYLRQSPGGLLPSGPEPGRRPAGGVTWRDVSRTLPRECSFWFIKPPLLQ